MARLKWTGDATFSDRNRDEFVAPGEVVEVPDDETDYYLDHDSGDWEHADDAEGEAEDDDAESEAAENRGGNAAQESGGTDGEPHSAEGTDGDPQQAEGAEQADTGDGDAEAEEEGDGDEFDSAAFVDRTPMQEVVDDIQSGEYDDHLDEIEQAEQARRDRGGVAAAVDERRSESE